MSFSNLRFFRGKCHSIYLNIKAHALSQWRHAKTVEIISPPLLLVTLESDSDMFLGICSLHYVLHETLTSAICFLMNITITCFDCFQALTNYGFVSVFLRALAPTDQHRYTSSLKSLCYAMPNQTRRTIASICQKTVGGHPTQNAKSAV